MFKVELVNKMIKLRNPFSKRIIEDGNIINTSSHDELMYLKRRERDGDLILHPLKSLKKSVKKDKKEDNK